jgi:hypothetical protein
MCGNKQRFCVLPLHLHHHTSHNRSPFTHNHAKVSKEKDFIQGHQHASTKCSTREARPFTDAVLPSRGAGSSDWHKHVRSTRRYCTREPASCNDTDCWLRYPSAWNRYRCQRNSCQTPGALHTWHCLDQGIKRCDGCKQVLLIYPHQSGVAYQRDRWY